MPTTNDNKGSVPAWRSYAYELVMAGHGTPLWDTDLTKELGGVHIGDVGYLEEGGFVRLFSISQSVVTTPELDEEPPHALVLGAIVQDARRCTRICHTASVTTSTVLEEATISLSFNLGGSHGAILVASHDMTRHNILHHTPLRTRMLRYHAAWLEDARKTKPTLKLEDLILVTGYETTPDVASAVYRGRDIAAAGIVFTPSHMDPSQAGNQELTWGHWTSADLSQIDESVIFRASTRDVDTNVTDSSVRCPFFRGYRMCANPRLSVGSTDASSEATSVDQSPSSLPSDEPNSSDDPLKPLFDYIFHVARNATHAIIHDNDFRGLLKTSETFDEDVPSTLKRVNPAVHLEDDGIASIDLRGLEGPSPAPSRATSVSSPSSSLPRKRASTASFTAAATSVFQPQVGRINEIPVSTPTTVVGEFFTPTSSSSSKSISSKLAGSGRPSIPANVSSGDVERGRRKVTNLSLSQSLGWFKVRKEESPTTASQMPELSSSELIQALLPPSVPAPQHARTFAQMFVTQELNLPFNVLHPIIASLCSLDSPPACQIPGWEIMATYWRRTPTNPGPNTFGTSERISHFSMLIVPCHWTMELWEPRYQAFTALVETPDGPMGVERDVVLTIRSWIEGAFGRLVTLEVIPIEERLERERSVDVLSKLLITLLLDVKVASRLDPADISTLFESLEGMVGFALTLDPNRIHSPIVPPGATALHSATHTPPRGNLAHRRRPSSNLVTLGSPTSISKVPLDCIIDTYVNFLTSQNAKLSYRHLETTIPVLCRVLAYYNAPLPVPSASVDSHSHPTSPYYKHVVEALSGMLSGPYSATVRCRLKSCLSPSIGHKRDVPVAIQVSTGAFRIIRVLIRLGLRDRLQQLPEGTRHEHVEDAELVVGGQIFKPSHFGRASREALKSWVIASLHGSTCEPVLEEAIGIINDVLHVYDASELQGLESDESVALGENLLEIVKYVKRYRPSGRDLFVVPLIDPKTAPSAFMRNLATLLCRDVAFTPLKPPLTEILMSIAEHLTDVDTAALPTLMSQQQALSPTNPEWIANWRNLLNMSALHAPSRPLTRQAIFDQLESLYSVLLDLPEYRVHLGGLVFEFIKAQADRKNADIDDTAWRIFSDEVVNRSMDIEHGPILYDDEGEVLVNQINLEVDNMLAFLQELACEGGEENAQTPLMTPSPTMSASTPPAIHPSIASRRPSEYPRLHMSLDAAASLATSTNPTPRLPDMPSEQTFLSPPKKPLAVSATATLVTSFGALVFTPRSLREHNLVVAVRIFRILLSTSLIASDQRSRLCALQFLIRMRADREHRLHFAQDVTTDNYVHSLAAQISRDRAAVPSDSILSFFRGDERRPRSTAEGDTSKEAPRFGRRGVKQSKLEPPSRSRSRAPPSLPRAAPLSLNAIWFFPDRPPFHLSQDQAFSERLTSYDPAGPGRKVVLPLSDYLDTITQILDGESDWEILSFVLCHLPSQLANKHLMCGPKCRTSIIKMFDAICTGIHSNTFASSINWPAQVYPSDATGLAYNSMIIFISYQVYLEPPRQHVLVETLYRGLSGPPAAQQCCLHGLTLCAYEMPVSMTKYLVQILDRLSQIMSSPSMPVNIMNFLHIVGNRPQLYANFTQEQYKKVFAVSLRYLQDFNKHSLAPGQSWAIAQHVRIMSYATLYIWFLSMDLADRPAHIPDITRGLLEANEGNAEVDEPTEVCFDWLARYTYSSADPRPARSALDEIVARATAKKPQGRDSGLAISDKTWLMGNSVVITIRTLPKLGWVEVLIRRPCGLTKFLCRLNNLPMVGPGEVDPDLLSVPGMLVMDKNVDEVPTEVFAPPPTEDEGKGQDSEGVAAEPPVPHPVTGYVWSGTAPSQRRKDVAIDPSFFALQLSAYPQGKRSFRGSLVTNQTALARFLRTFDNRPVIDTHKVGVLYVGPGQTNEEAILANAHGSPSYTRFLANLGRLINLHGQNDVYTGELEPGLDGDYAYAWWDDIGQIVYHVATLMPTIAPDAPDADQRRHRKKMHIGNDFVRIVWNDSGVPYAFDTLRTQVQFVNVVVEPHSAGTIGAFSADRHEHEYFRVSVQRAAGMPRFSPLGDYKLVSARSLPALVRQISLHADWFANTFQATGADTRKEDVVTNWRERLRAIRRFADLMSKEAAAVPEPEVEEGILGEQSIRDFTIKY